MSQNRNKLIDLFIGNISNAITHQLLEQAIRNEDIAKKYLREERTSWDIAKKYREKINPVNLPLPQDDAEMIRKKVVIKVKNELSLRISRGYTNLDVALVEGVVEEALRKIRII